jgi:hypothetical protein
VEDVKEPVGVKVAILLVLSKATVPDGFVHGASQVTASVSPETASLKVALMTTLADTPVELLPGATADTSGGFAAGAGGAEL